MIANDNPTSLEHDPLATEETCRACQAGDGSYGFRPYDHKAVTKHRPRNFDEMVEHWKAEFRARRGAGEANQ